MNKKTLLLFAIVGFVFCMADPSIAAQTGGITKDDIADMMGNVLHDLAGDITSKGNFITLFMWFNALIGTLLVMAGIRHIAKDRNGSKGGAVIAMVIGVILISSPEFLSVINGTVFDSDKSYEIVSAQPKTGGSAELSAAAKTFVQFAVFIIQVVGCLAVYRGFKTMADVSLSGQRQPEAMRTAWIFLVAGIFCINILGTLGIMANTLGGKVTEFYGKVFGHLL